jgi:hypothetical protein
MLLAREPSDAERETDDAEQHGDAHARTLERPERAEAGRWARTEASVVGSQVARLPWVRRARRAK